VPTAWSYADGYLSGPSTQVSVSSRYTDGRRHRIVVGTAGIGPTATDDTRYAADTRSITPRVTVGTKMAVGTALTWHGGSNGVNMCLLRGAYADGQAVGTRSSKFSQKIYTSFFINSKYFNLFIYVLLSSIYTSCTNSYPRSQLHPRCLPPRFL
jgi:hypothetical protein